MRDLLVLLPQPFLQQAAQQLTVSTPLMTTRHTPLDTVIGTGLGDDVKQPCWCCQEPGSTRHQWRAHCAGEGGGGGGGGLGQMYVRYKTNLIFLNNFVLQNKNILKKCIKEPESEELK